MHGGPWVLPFTGGFLPSDIGKFWNWWQLGFDPTKNVSSSMVEACEGAYSQTVAMCPGDHRRSDDEGISRKRVTSSALSRLLRVPNDYQSISDLMLNTVRDLYGDGNFYWLGLQNDRKEFSELHLFPAHKCKPRVATTGDIFYSLSGNEIIEKRLIDEGIDPQLLRAVPARFVCHGRLHTPENQLIGVSPVMAAAIDVASQNAAVAQQLAFFTNRSRPGAVLGTDQILTPEQAGELRELWNQQSSGLNAGKTPILTAGLKPFPIYNTSQRDAELADTMKMNAQNIALVYRIPLQILGIGPTPFASTEALMSMWLASGLGFSLNHIEETIGRFFGLAGYPYEYVKFDTRALLRSDHKARLDALKSGVQGGIYTPNEAREQEGLPPVKFGDQPRLQQQMVPLEYGANLKPPQKTPKPSPSSQPPAPSGTPPAPAGQPARQFDERNCEDSGG